MLRTPHLLGADVPPGGAIGVTQTGRIATGECQYVSMVLGADIPHDRGSTIGGSGCTAIESGFGHSERTYRRW
jgi:hypothetical protein